MRFSVLGPLLVEADGQAVPVGGGRQRALLALLLVRAGEVVSRHHLIEQLWSGEPPASASQSLDTYISRLRKALREAGAADVLQTRAPGYVLDADDVDARSFEALVAEGQAALAAGDSERAGDVLRNALAMWRGRAYAEVADELWARSEAERLEELRLSALEARVDADLALARHAALVPELEHLVAQHSTRERLVGQLMIALYRSGRQADALAAYRSVRQSLVDELGLEPGPQLRSLEAAVLAHDPALDLPQSPLRPPAGVRRGGRARSRPVALAAAAVVAVAGIAAILVGAGGTAGPSGAMAANSAGTLDPASGQVTASVAVGSNPAGITSGGGRIWVTNGADGTVTRIDPSGAHVDQTVGVGSSPAGIVFGGGSIWVANALDGSVSRIDPRAGTVVQTIDVGKRPVALASGAGAIWVADTQGNAVVPLDPYDGVARRSVRLEESPSGVAVGFGALWVTESAARKLVRIDPRTRTVVAEIGMGGGAGPVAAGAGAVWVVNTLDGTVSRVDPARNSVASTVPVGAAPTAVAADGHGVWVADAGAAKLLSLDPEGGAVRRSYGIGAAPVAVALVAGAPWVAAGEAVGGAHRGGTLRVEYTTIRRFDPAFALFDAHPAIWQATGDTLVGLAESSGSAQLVPELATTVPLPTDGGRRYAFKIRPGVVYSDGRRVRASDFRRALERLYATHSPLAAAYQSLRGADACAHAAAHCDLSSGVLADDRAGTVVLRLANPDPGLLYRLTLPAAQPAPPGTPRAQIASRPIPSTGPYRVGSFVPGKRLLLVRNERFHEWSRAAQPDGYADRIDIRFHDDPNARVAAVLRGDADLAIEIANARLAPLRTRDASQLRLHGQPNTSFLLFNVRQAPFDDVRARRALNLALDRAALARRFGGRTLSTPTCQILPPHFPGHVPYCPWTRRPGDGRWHGPDLARARALVRASGTTGTRPIVVMRRDDPEGNASAGVVAAALRAIGYRPRVIRDDAEWARRTGDPHGDWSLGVGNWIADYPSPDQFLDYFLSCSQYRPAEPASSVNSGGFCNAHFDRLVRRAEQLQLTNPANAERVWARADRLAVDEAAWAPMVTTASVELLSRRTGHFTLDANSQPQIDQLWVR